MNVNAIVPQEVKERDQVDDANVSKINTKEEPMTVKLRDQTGGEVVFRIKRSSPMSKVFEAYVNRLGYTMSDVEFRLDGERLKETDTPNSLNLAENDQIDVFRHQVGGSEEAPNNNDASELTLIVQDPGSGSEVHFKVKRDIKFERLFHSYATKRGIMADSLRFLYNGKHIHKSSTPKMLEMVDGDEIQVVAEQTGG